MTLAGFPKTTTFGGTSFITTDPAPIIEFFPTRTFGNITELTNILTLSSMTVSSPSFVG